MRLRPERLACLICQFGLTDSLRMRYQHGVSRQLN